MILFQPHKYPCYEFGFGSVDEILSVSSKTPVLQHDDELISATDKAVLDFPSPRADTDQVEVPFPSSETGQVNTPSHRSEKDEDAVPIPSSDFSEVIVPPSDENEVPSAPVGASPPCSETDEDKVEIPAKLFQKRNENTKVNILRFL